MAKTYEIWRKVNPADDRYDFATYTKAFDVSPIGEVTLNTNLYDEEIFYRTELGSSLFLDGADFYKLLCAKQDTVVNDLVYLLVILDDGVVYWKGFLSLFNGQWDEDECTCELPVRVFDDYSGLLDNRDIIKNLIVDVTNKHTFYGSTNTWVEFKTVYSASGEPSGQLINGWTLWELFRVNNPSNLNVYTYSRKRASCPINANYTAYEEDGEIIYTLNFLYPDFSNMIVDDCINDYSATHYKIYSGGNIPLGEDCIWANIANLETGDEDSQDYENAMRFEDIVNVFAGEFGYTFVSEFYLNATNPITLSANKLNDILWLQGSDASTPTATEKARVLNLSFSGLMSFFKDHNARWYIDDNGDFRAEHIKYFEGDLSYTAAKLAGIDATQKVDTRTDYVSIAKTNKYGYDFSKIFKFEQFAWSLADTENFIGVKIFYDDETVNAKSEDNTKNHDSLFFTDFPYVLSKPNEINNDSILVVATEPDGDDFQIFSEVGLLDGTMVLNRPYEPVRDKSYPNNHLSWGNLHPTYFKYDRILIEGNMNNAVTVFETNKPIIIQEEIKFPLCPDTFNPLKYIKTNLGENGLVVNATESMRTGMLNVTLEYRALDNMRECVCLVPTIIKVGSFIVGADCQEIS